MVSEEESEKEAAKAQTTMRRCPNLVASGTAGKRVYSVYAVPEEREWWLRYPETVNKEIGWEKYRVQVFENPMFGAGFKLEALSAEKPPCGADCEKC